MRYAIARTNSSRGRIRFVEAAPLFTQLADVELETPRERLLTDGDLPAAGMTDRGRRLARFPASRDVGDG
jgi:hypothetical protein